VGAPSLNTTSAVTLQTQLYSVPEELSFIARAAIAGVLIAAAAAKVVNLHPVAFALMRAHSLRLPVARFATISLATSEFTVGGLLFAAVRTSHALWAAFGILGVFTIYLARQSIVTPGAGCGCFDGRMESVGVLQIGRNTLLIVLTLCAILGDNSANGLSNLPVWDGRPKLLSASIGLVAALALAYELLRRAQTILDYAKAPDVAGS
jgi:hypothetical protein